MKRTIYSHGLLVLNNKFNHFIIDVNRCLQIHRNRDWGINNRMNQTSTKLLSAFKIQDITVFFVTNPLLNETIVLLPTECDEYQERMNLL